MAKNKSEERKDQRDAAIDLTRAELATAIDDINTGKNKLSPQEIKQTLAAILSAIDSLASRMKELS